MENSTVFLNNIPFKIEAAKINNKEIMPMEIKLKIIWGYNNFLRSLMSTADGKNLLFV